MTASPGSETSFLHLNIDRCWAGFEVHGLDLGADGALRLRSLPRVRTDLPAELASAPAPTAPAGITAAPDSSILYVGAPDPDVPAGDRVLRVDGCDGSTAGAPCIGGMGDDATRLRDARGLLVHERWRQLLVAEAGTGRVQRFELETWQLVGSWGADAGLAEPWALAPDGHGGVLVVDVGAGAIRAFDRAARPVPGPWADMAGQTPSPTRPVGVATVGEGEGTTIYVLDGDGRRVLAYDPDGRLRATFGADVLRAPLAIAATATAVFVGDNGTRRVHVFRPDGTAIGEHLGPVDGYRGPVAGLAVRRDGELLIHPGVSLAPLAAAPDGGWSSAGWAWGGPFTNPGDLARAWHLVTATAELPVGAHLQLFAYAASPSGPGPATTVAPPWSTGAIDLVATFRDEGLAEARWIAVPVDTSAAVLHALQRPLDDGLPASGASAAARRLSCLWLGLALTSDGSATAAVHQLRIDFDVETGLGHLPAIYAEQGTSSRFLARYLALGGTVLSDVEARIDALPSRFDAGGAPPAALGPLAGWLGLEIDGEWDETELRDSISGAFEAYGRRGTVAGLREAVRRYARADIHVEEPLANAGWWVLGDETTEDDCHDVSVTEAPMLGFSTMLAAVEPQGAVLGTSAIVDGSQLLADDEVGTGLFSNLADRFTALVYRGARHSTERLEEIRAVIDREKPAGAVYDLCVVEPTLRVGYQARIGIDTIVAGEATPSRLGDTDVAGLVLGGEVPLGMGDGIELGRSTRLVGGS